MFQLFAPRVLVVHQIAWYILLGVNLESIVLLLPLRSFAKIHTGIAVNNLQVLMALLDMAAYALIPPWQGAEDTQWLVYLFPKHHHVRGKPSYMVNCAAVSCCQKRQVHIPLFVISLHKATDNFGQCLVEPLYETIQRRMIGVVRFFFT